ncbi:hypothetical protein [Actinoplanes palleronii]|uniref:Uncharacterized protein n=1 Tax=Actinoplanes palleronii TaxID=113570 RepID=A0ABQ4B9Y0_9ACTN|nr:hypothetical protein [Actinoplanes palleronii]GIE67439.1 hypothetical protein Apa02nite_035470 [Actinoplanes palleronii]
MGIRGLQRVVVSVADRERPVRQWRFPVSDVDVVTAAAEEAGATVIEAPADQQLQSVPDDLVVCLVAGAR